MINHAIKIDEDLCIGCSHCMNACPTEAIRVWNGLANIDDASCIDCGECKRVCPVNAIYVEQESFEKIFNYTYRIALIPSIFLGQFPETTSTTQIYAALEKVGFTHIFEVEQVCAFLKENIKQYQENYQEESPLISTYCPAIVRLIQVKFPSLVDQLMKLNPPAEIAAAYFQQKLISEGIPKEELGIFYVTPCAAKMASLAEHDDNELPAISGTINSNSLFNRVFREIKNNTEQQISHTEPPEIPDFAIKWSLTRGEAKNATGRTLAIDGMRNAMEFLEMVENDEVAGIDFLECRACSESCAGGILNASNRYLIVERLKKRIENNRSKPALQSHNALTQTNQLKINSKDIPPRSIMMLDTDIARAMKKMKQAQKIERDLPGIDCGVCGAPSCKALAEDIVKGNATLSHCIFIQNKRVKNNEINMDTALGIIRNIWGNRSLK